MLVRATIKGAPAAMKFSTLAWSNVDLRHIPAGVQFSTLGKKGEEELPMLEIRMAVPTGASGIRPFESTSETADLTGVNFLPSQTRVNDSTVLHIYDAKSYTNKESGALELTRQIKFRTLRFVTLRIPLCDVANTASKRLKTKFTTGISFTVNGAFQNALSAPVTQRHPDPLFTSVESRMVANSNDLTRFASQFRNVGGKLIPSSKGAKMVLGADTTQPFDMSMISWIDRNAPYVKLMLTRTGLYRTTPQEILSRGGSIDVSQWTAGSVRLFNHGHEVPIWVDSTSDGHVVAVEFYGERLPGFPGQYFNVATDSNAYWLTNSTKFSSAPMRYKPRAPSTASSTLLTTGNISLHHERDHYFYAGDETVDQSAIIQRTEWVPSRQLVWAELDPPAAGDISQLVDTLMIDQLPPSTTGKTALFTAYIRGISLDSAPNHHYRITINGTLVSDVTFRNYDSVFVQQSIPLSALNVGMNVVVIQSIGVPNTNDRFYVDYYNLALEEGLVPSADTAIAKNQMVFTENSPSTIFGLHIQSADTPQLFNLTDTTRLAPVSTNSGSTDFRDSSFAVSPRYVGSTASGFLHADQITPWNILGVGGWSILDTSRGADFIILTHPIFSQAASEDSAFRKNQRASLRIKVVNTDEVFNAFDFGSNEPWAIRQFLHYAYDKYNGTPPGFVTLFGDATWVSKTDFVSPQIYRRSFVPTYGEPVSDYIYTTFGTAGTDSIFSPTMVISRIPAANVTDAQNYIDKLIQYETSEPAEWNKRFLFLLGGDLGSTYNQFLSEFQAFTQSPQFGGLQLRPMTIDTFVVRRSDFSGGIDYTHESEVRDFLRQGASILYFAGHGAPQYSDISMGVPNEIRNNNLLTTLITLSCRTGAFAEPDVLSINEGFINAPHSGAVLAFGTTGFGEVTYDLYLSQAMWLAMDADSTSNDSTRNAPRRLNLPSVFTLSKVLGGIRIGSGSFQFEVPNSLNQYLILGDALTGFAFRPEAELAALASDLQTQNVQGVSKTVFSVADSAIVVNATVRNFGYSAEGVVNVRIRDVGPKSTRDTIISLPNGLDHSALLTASFSLDTNAIGQHTISVFVDEDNRYNEANENDNIASVGVLVTGSSITPLYPPEGARSFCDVSRDSVYLLMLTPATSGSTSTFGTLEIQVDTTIRFTSPTEIVKSLPVTSSTLQFTIPKLQLPISSTGVLWWRAQFTSKVGVGQWVVHSINTDQSTPYEFSYTSSDQLGTAILGGLQLTQKPALALPLGDTVTIEIRSHGNGDSTSYEGEPVSYIFINGKEVLDTSATSPLPVKGTATVALAIFTADGTAVESFYSFTYYPVPTKSAQDSMAAIFDSVVQATPAGRMIAIFTNNSPGSQYFAPDIQPTLASLGAKLILNNLRAFSSYALLTIKGQPGLVKEVTGNPSGAGSEIYDTVIAYNHYGVAQTPFTSVAQHYGNLKWHGVATSSASNILFTILGHSRLSGSIDSIVTFSGANGTSFPLDTIDARQHDELAVLMQFMRDSTATTTPELSSIELEYQPAPELELVPQSLTVQPKAVQEGYPVFTSYKIQNLTCVPVSNLLTELIPRYPGFNTPFTHSGLSLAAHASTIITDSIATFGLNGTVYLTASVNPNEAQNEQYLFNDQDTSSFVVSRDSTKPQLDVLVENRHVYNCDYVSSRPVITMSLVESSPVRQTDSLSISAILTDQTGQLFTLSKTSTNSLFNLQFIHLQNGNIQAQLTATPAASQALTPGQWTLTVAANDASGNKDTVSVCFTVATTNGLDHVMNVPNPFRDNTSFTYQLRTGGAAEVKIVIYTIAGRKIRTLYPDPALPPHAGLNYIQWDGRDESGNIVANGTYLYRVVLAGSNPDGSAASDAVSERAVKSK
jgi:hypothetical protein